jgi:hypothetical protein
MSCCRAESMGKESRAPEAGGYSFEASVFEDHAAMSETNIGDPTTEDMVRDAVQKYLSGEWDFDAIDDWIDDLVMPQRFATSAAGEMISQISLMACEVTLSGRLRSENEFRSDVESLLAGRELTAFYPFMDERLRAYQADLSAAGEI